MLSIIRERTSISKGEDTKAGWGRQPGDQTVGPADETTVVIPSHAPFGSFTGAGRDDTTVAIVMASRTVFILPGSHSRIYAATQAGSSPKDVTASTEASR